MGAEGRRIASLLTTATMVLNANVAVSDVQVSFVIHPGKPRGVETFPGKSMGK